MTSDDDLKDPSYKIEREIEDSSDVSVMSSQRPKGIPQKVSTRYLLLSHNDPVVPFAEREIGKY